MAIKVLNEFLPQAEEVKLGAIKVGDTLDIDAAGTLNLKDDVAVENKLTDCILEIPQDIKLTLSEGTLTLASGSVITGPNGTQKTTTVDRSVTITTNATWLIFSDMTTGAITNYTRINRAGSGTTLPADDTDYAIFLNKTDQKLYAWSDNAWSEWKKSLPIAIVTVSNGAISSIDQVFNGLGYIGTTVFALPGIKYLIPDGRNTDGTLKNIKYTTTHLAISGNEDAARNGVYLYYNGAVNRVATIGYTYNEIENKYYYTLTGEGRSVCKAATLEGNITKFIPKLVFRSVDYNDLNELAEEIIIDDQNNVKKTGTNTVSATNTWSGANTFSGTTTFGANTAGITQTVTDSSTKFATTEWKEGNDNLYRTNCLLTIPQNLKFELDNGTLTLKSGSIVTFANGNTNTTSQDQTFTYTTNGTYIIISDGTGSLARCVFPGISSATEPTDKTTGTLWYNPTDNVVKRWNGSVWGTRTLPLCIITVSGGQISSIDQVFNGFSFVGSTIFALPNVKGLCPNGRTAEGYLNNSVFVTTSVLATTISQQTVANQSLILNASTFKIANVSYDYKTNYNSVSNCCIIGSLSIADGSITTFTTKEAFQTVEQGEIEDITGDIEYLKTNYVTLNTAQTITVQKTFTTDPLLRNNNTNSALVEKNTGIATNGTTPGTQQTRGISITANDDSVTGEVINTLNTNGTNETSLSAKKLVSGSTVTSTIKASVTSQGQTYAEAPTPSSVIDNSTKIATTAWTQTFTNTIRTNCITETANDLSFTLVSNGTLTLNAGSKVYVPNGSGTFTPVTVAQDCSTSRADSQDCMVWYNNSTPGAIQVYPLSLFFSGTSAPTGYTYMFWYDTTNNKCKVTTDSGSTWTDNKSLPLAVVETDGSKISKIKTVFNGSGYVGSSIFVLPGVSGIIPKGRHTNGTLLNNSFTRTAVAVCTLTTQNLDHRPFATNGGANTIVYNNQTYDADNNQLYATETGTLYDATTFAYASAVNGRIKEFEQKFAFHAVDYNDLKDLDIGGNTSGNTNSLLDFKWSDHILNDASWLRADTWSWQDGAVYTAAYAMLNEAYTGGTTASETVAGFTITYKLAENGMKIVDASNAGTVQDIFDACGVSWYYIIDTTNTKFKLPRTKYGFSGLRDTVGKYVSESLPNITGDAQTAPGKQGYAATGALKTKSWTSQTSVLNGSTASGTVYGIAFDASSASATYQNDAPVQERTTQMYLYFFVGNTVRNQTEVDVGEITDVLNTKWDSSNMVVTTALPANPQTGVFYFIK